MAAHPEFAPLIFKDGTWHKIEATQPSNMTKNAFEQALELYSKHPEMNLWDDVKQHMEYRGYVCCGPKFFAMIRPVLRDFTPEMLADLGYSCPLKKADCWYVWLLTGSLKEAVKHLPCKLPWVGFAQRGEPARFIELEKALAKIG